MAPGDLSPALRGTRSGDTGPLRRLGVRRRVTHTDAYGSPAEAAPVRRSTTEETY
jgi:hypothetical protein